VVGRQQDWAEPTAVDDIGDHGGRLTRFKVMTGFSANIRPEVAEKHNMTLNKVG
jgi:hypothetical protein